ncbi:MAG: AsnC family transcriptional regulator [Oscillospiraceae bacterium]|jgi:DNA-binding Lrp family transcriptional regulator|nr:MAG: AsnC family transcriptional regulator [Oscillospiraceae bacterium]
MDRKILEMLEADGRLTAKQIALMLDKEEGEIRDMIQKFEADGVILGYKAIVDWDKTDREYATALIELKVTPQYNRGFDAIAERIYNYPEVQSVYLMSGAYDLCVILEGKTIREVALFVAQRLAPLEAVLSTATHFVLRKYKDKGVIYGPANFDERGNCN